MNTDDLYSGGAALDSQLEPYSDITHYNSASATENNAMDTQQLSDNQAQEDEEDSDSIEEQEDEDDLSILMRSWINERSSPELLEYEGSALENLMELVDFQMQKIQTQQVPFIGNILKMDVDRIKYLVRSYLRTRLGKIEDHVKYYLDNQVYRERMSQSELDYAKGFAKLEVNHVKRSFLDQLPPHLRGLDEVSSEGLDMVTKPDLDSAVFCRVRTTVGEFQFEQSEDPIVMKRNNIFITRYSIIRDLMEDGKVELI